MWGCHDNVSTSRVWVPTTSGNMNYSGPASLAEVEADLLLSDDEDIADKHWPPLDSHTQHAGPSPWQPHVDVSQPAPRASTSKRSMDQSSDTSDSPSPASKVSRHVAGNTHTSIPDSSYIPAINRAPAVVFAPRSDYVKLMFIDNPTVDVKLRWLSEITKAFSLDRELAEVKMAAITSRFVYISRKRANIIESATKGEFLSLKLDLQDSTERPMKYTTYLVTRYPVGVDPSLAKELPGVYAVRRFKQHDTPINRLVVTWSLPHPPPQDYCFSFLPCLPPCEFRRMSDERPTCFRCWDIGHISRYCQARLDKCGWCAGTHSTRTCPHRTPSQPSTDDAALEHSPQPAPDTSKWKCPRCNEPGVNVWHGCLRRSRTATSLAVNMPPPPPPPSQRRSPDASLPLATPPTDSPQVLALREAVTNLTARCTAITARFDAIESRIDKLTTQHATTERTLASLVESHHAVIATVATFSEKMEALVARFEKISEQLLKEPPKRTPQDNPKPRGRLH